MLRVLGKGAKKNVEGGPFNQESLHLTSPDLIVKKHPLGSKIMNHEERFKCKKKSTSFFNPKQNNGDEKCPDVPKRCSYVGVSKNRGTPKWMVYNGKPHQNG